MTAGVNAAVAEAFHEEWGRVVAALIRLTGDWDLAEECAQDAFARALERWPDDGPARMYVNRCREYHVAGPEQDWDGVYVMTHK